MIVAEHVSFCIDVAVLDEHHRFARPLDHDAVTSLRCIGKRGRNNIIALL